MDRARKTIYYDGNCAACSNLMLRVKHSKKKEAFTTIDYHLNKLPQGLTQEDIAKEIHVVDNLGGIHKNFDAILTILEEYSRWKIFVSLFRLPFFYQIGVIGYKLFAANRHLIFGKVGRILWVKIVVALGFLTSLLITSNLWVTKRTFPLIPAIFSVPNLPVFFDYYTVAALIILLFFIIILPNPRKVIFLFAALFFLLVFFDINRLQIFNYQYIFMLLTLGFFSWNYKDITSANRVLNTCRLIIICIYIWGGLQKLNLYFFVFSFPWVIDPITRLLPTSMHQFIYSLGALIPFFESGIGIGLLFRRTRIYAVFGATALHLIILFTLGPLGHNYAPSIWPWNIAMILFVYLLFWNEKSSYKNIFWIKKFAFYNIILLLFGIMPLFSFFNLWDTYLSFSMYAGNTNYAYMSFSNNSKNSLPSGIRQATQGSLLNIPAWGYDVFGVLPYPESRVYKKIGADVCKYIKNKNNAKLVIVGKRTLFNADKPVEYTCSELL